MVVFCLPSLALSLSKYRSPVLSSVEASSLKSGGYSSIGKLDLRRQANQEVSEAFQGNPKS